MNKYEVLGVVGEGAYGVVLRCRKCVSVWVWNLYLSAQLVAEVRDQLGVGCSKGRKQRTARLFNSSPPALPDPMPDPDPTPPSDSATTGGATIVWG